MQLSLNTDENVILANKLQRLTRSAFPVAVRQSLDSAAFDMKKHEIEKSAQKRFRKRHPGNIYKRFTRVNKANGFDVKAMKAQTGWTNLPGSDFAENQMIQNRGGKIDARSFIPMNEARGNSGQVKPRFRTSKIKNKKIIDAKKVTSRRGKGGGRVTLRDDKQKFVTAAIAAKQQFGTDAFVISQFDKNGSRVLFHINKARPSRSGVKLKYTPIYTVKGDRKAPIKGSNYLTEAGDASGKKMDKFFRNSAQRQFDKALR